MENLVTIVPPLFLNRVKEQSSNFSMLVVAKLLSSLNRKIEALEQRESTGYDEEWHKTHPKHSYVNNTGCGCELCLLRSQYTAIKIVAHRLRKRLDAEWTIYPGPVWSDTNKELLKHESNYTTLRNRSRKLVKEIAVIKKNKCWVPVY